MENAGDPDGGTIEGREKIEKKAEEKEAGLPFQYLADQSGLSDPRPPPAAEGERNDDPGADQEKGKEQISGSPAVPNRRLQIRINRVGVSRIAGDQHRRDRRPPKGIDG